MKFTSYILISLLTLALFAGCATTNKGNKFTLQNRYFNNMAAEVYKASAYCSCKKCCGKYPWDKGYGITASGKKAKWGTVAVDTKVIKLGSKLRIDYFPDTIFRAEDIGSSIKGKRIDVWFPRHKDALQFGVQKILVQVVRG